MDNLGLDNLIFSEYGLLSRIGSPVSAHLSSVEKFLPFCGVRDKLSLFQPNDPMQGSIDVLLRYLDADFTDEELRIWHKILPILNNVERFNGDANLVDLGGNVFEHTMFSCILARQHFLALGETSLTDYEKEIAKKLYNKTIRAILVHDVGEWIGEFGTLGQYNLGITAKDCNYERRLTESIFQLSQTEENFTEVALGFQQRGIAAINEANQLNKDQRDDALLNSFSIIYKDITELLATKRLSIEQKDLTQKHLELFDQAENCSSFVGCLARAFEKLEGSLHFLVLISKGRNIKIIGGNHCNLSITSTAKYNELLLPKLIAHSAAEVELGGQVVKLPRQISGFLISQVLKDTYVYMAGYSLANCGVVNRDRNEGLEPLAMAATYLLAAEKGYEPTSNILSVAEQAKNNALDELLKVSKADKIMLEKWLQNRRIGVVQPQ